MKKEQRKPITMFLHFISGGRKNWENTREKEITCTFQNHSIHLHRKTDYHQATVKKSRNLYVSADSGMWVRWEETSNKESMNLKRMQN